MNAKGAFPEGFVWGTATASFQIEGGRTERGRCIWDDFCDWPGKVFQGHSGDVADDHYHLFRDDVALMARMGLGAYRFSISWPRVQPDGQGDVNAKGLDFYDALVDELLEHGIEPYITLYHWDLPSALQSTGGWVVRDTAARFRDYAAIVAERLGDRVSHWITHNEPWVVAFLGNLMGIHAPGWQDLSAALQVAHHVLLSHGLAVPVLRDACGEDAQIGITLNLSPAYAATDSDDDRQAQRTADGYANRWFLDPVLRGSYPEDMCALYDWHMPNVAPGDLELIQAPIDFLGINNYSRQVVASRDDASLGFGTVRPEGQYTAMDWEVFPQGLEDLLVRLGRDYPGIDFYITENGSSWEDRLGEDGRVHDPERESYLRAYLQACARAIAQGVPLRGYFGWSLLDNFEWAYGYSRRFGLVYVDFETQQRIIKDSGEAYARIARANAWDA